MKRLLCLLALALFANAFARPTMLIYQVRMLVGQGKDDDNVSITDDIARELNSYGKVDPIIYSSSSLIVKTALEAHKISDAPSDPSRDQILAIGRALGCKYVLITQATREGKYVNTLSELHRVGGRKPIWGPVPQNFSALVGAKVEPKVAAATAGRTIALQLITVPLKDEAAEPELETPSEGVGTGTNANPAAFENQPWVDAQAAFAAKDYGEAASLLRAAADKDPTNGDIRAMLVESYLNLALVDAAFDEITRALRLIPDHPKLMLAQARAYMTTGRLRESEAAYRTLLAKEATNLAAILGLAEALLARLQPEEAEKLYRQARQMAPKDPDVACALAETLALQGDYEGSLKERDAAIALGLSKDAPSNEQRYVRLMGIVTVAVNQLATDLGDLATRITLAKGKYDLELISAVAGALGRANSLASYVEQMQYSQRFRESHARRIFGLNLLSDSVVAMKRVVEQGQADALNDATVSRGEALREVAAANALLENERARPTKKEEKPKDAPKP